MRFSAGACTADAPLNYFQPICGCQIRLEMLGAWSRSGRHQSMAKHDFFHIGQVGLAGNIDRLSNFLEIPPPKQKGLWLLAATYVRIRSILLKKSKV
jgi:hypothetical protein